MPNGEFSPSRKTVLVLATPSPSVSRRSMMRFGLRRQHVAIRKDIDRARMIEPGGEGIDGQAVGGGRLAACRPGGRGGDGNSRNQLMFRWWQDRGGPKCLLDG